MVEAGRFRSVGLAVLAVGVVIGPAAVLAGGGLGSSPPGAGSTEGWLLGEAESSTPADLESLGASGVLPTMQELRPAVVATMVAPGGAAALPLDSISIPPVVLDAYRRAESILAQRAPECGVPWSLLAGVGRVVSDHARGGGIDERGTTTGPILGPRLDGSPGIAEIPDTDDGRLDGDKNWDRAAGPMQIIPVVWQRVGADSDRDGTADPHNVYDATLAAGRYLCENGADLATPEGQVQAVFRYQRSEPFVRSSMLWARVYDAAAPAPPAEVSALPSTDNVPLSGEPPPPPPLPSGPTSTPVPPRPERPPPPGTTPTTTPPTTTPPTTTPPPTTQPPTTQPPTTQPTTTQQTTTAPTDQPGDN